MGYNAPQPARLSRSEMLMLLTLAAINFSHIMDFMIMMPLETKLERAFGIGPGEFSILVSSYTIAAGIASFTGTFLVDRFDRKQVLLVCYTGFLAGTALCGFAGSYTFLLTARTLTGLLGGIIGSTVLSIVGDCIDAPSRGRATGLVMTGFSAASVLGVPAGILAADAGDWTLPFLGIAAFGLPVFALAFRVLPPVRQHLTQGVLRRPWPVLRDVLSPVPHRLALLFTVLVAFSHFTMVPFLSPYMVCNVGFAEKELGYIYLTGGFLTLFSGPLVGRLTDRYGASFVFSVLVLLAFIPQIAISRMPPVELWIALVFTSLFFIFSGGRFVPSQALTLSAIDPRLRGGFMSLNSSVMQLASGLAAFLAGKVVSKGSGGRLLHYEWVGYSTLLFSMLSVAMAWQISRFLRNSAVPYLQDKPQRKV